MEITITAIDGKRVILTTRDQEHRFAGKINHVSSTDAQPYIAANFAVDGTLIGGQTLTESYLNRVLNQAEKAGAKIERLP
jgi:hypothetical protein